jgi:hypothetical protein
LVGVTRWAISVLDEIYARRHEACLVVFLIRAGSTGPSLGHFDDPRQEQAGAVGPCSAFLAVKRTIRSSYSLAPTRERHRFEIHMM